MRKMWKLHTRKRRFYVLTSKTNVYTHLLFMGTPQSPLKINMKGVKILKEDSRDFIVPIRMSFNEKENIKSRAMKSGKNISTFIRDSALGCEIKEKPDKIFYDVIIKEMGKFTRTLNELERLLYHKNFIDERVLKNEIDEWRNFRMEIKQKYL